MKWIERLLALLPAMAELFRPKKGAEEARKAREEMERRRREVNGKLKRKHRR